MDILNSQDAQWLGRAVVEVDDPLDQVPPAVLDVARAAVAEAVALAAGAEHVRELADSVVIAVVPWLVPPDEIPWGYLSVEPDLDGDVLGGMRVGPDLYPTAWAAQSAGGPNARVFAVVDRSVLCNNSRHSRRTVRPSSTSRGRR